ncbi:MAG: phage holin family protein [Clostridiales bacterium]|nr:phage holin family protein [Clostridiales bacterium]
MRDFFAHTFDLLLKGLTAAGGFLAGMFGGEGKRYVVLLLVLMVVDYITGVTAAAMGKNTKPGDGKLGSKAGFKGLTKKGIIFLVVGLAHGLDVFVNKGNSMFLSAVAWFYIGSEALSLVENLAYCGVPVPAKLKAALEGLSGKRLAEGKAAGE